ncbi:hypothetical protein ACROYT_G044241 [Oculina patagonica]
MNAFLVIFLTLGAASAMPLGYQKGQRYTYKYQSDVTHAVPSGTAKTLGLRVKCQAHLDVLTKTEIQITLADIQVHQVIGSLKDPKQQQEKAPDQKVVAVMRQRLELPVRVVLKAQDGSIKEINAHPKDDEWSLNIKRGLVNLFQISPRADQQQEKQFVTQLETTAVGECQVSYVIVRDNSQSAQKEQVMKVSKVINYEKCQNRPEFIQRTFNIQKCDKCQQSMGFAPYHRSVGQIEHTLKGSDKTGYIISRTEAVEQHVITPFSRSDGQVSATARQILEFQKPSKAGQALTTLTKRTTHKLVAENIEQRARENADWQVEMTKQAEVTINEMCQAIQQWKGQQAAEKFTFLVEQLRQCNKNTLVKLADKMLARQDPSERKFCIDALSFVGTPEAVQVLKMKIQEKKINKPDELKRVFLGLASASRPTADHINIAWELCNHAEVVKDMSARRQCMLTFGALIHKINQRPSLQQDTKAKAACQQYVKEILNRLAKEQTTAEEKVMYIKAIGNAASSEAQEQLHKILKDKTQPLHIRVQSVWALRRIVLVAREKVTPRLISVFADAKESPELRMACFLLLLNSEPNFATLQAVANIVKREITSPIPGPRSNQVASYVLSHLSALAYHNNVLTKKRSMQARLALRLMPKMSYGLGYSKGMRFAYHSEKFQTGFELEANKMDVPDSMLPRNMNARILLNLMGYQTSALEFGARIENMDDVIEQVISEVRNRHKRSLWGNILSWFNEETEEASGDDSDEKNPTTRPTQRSTSATSFSRRHSLRNSQSTSTKASTKASTRPTTRSSTRPTSQPTGSQRTSTRQRPTFPSSDGQTKSQRVSAYMKLFGDEVKFMEFKQQDIKQFAQDISDLLMGKKERIEYLDKGIVITKKGVEITQRLEKALQLAHGRRMVPTLAGIPLDFQYRSAAVVKVIAAAKMNVEPSIISLLKWQNLQLTGGAEIIPSIGAHEHTQIGIHTPYLRMGLQVKTAAHANPEQKIDVNFDAGKEYKFTYNLPKEQREILHVKYDTHGFAEEKNPENCQITQQQISLDFKTPHLKKLEKTCKGQNLFGVQLCVEGQFPDLPALRLQQVPVFPTIALTELRVSMAPASDKPTAVQWIHQVTKNDDKEMQVLGRIDASSNSVSRQIPYKVTYTRANQQLLVEAQKVKAPGYEDSMLTCTINRAEGLKLQFGQGKLQYQVSAAGQVQDQGKTMRLQLQWTEVPEQWKKFFYNWKPQIWYFLQQFAWVRRSEQFNKQVAIEFSLTSPMTALLRVKTPDAIAERTDLSLPVRVDRFPQSLQEIKNYFYAQCEVQDSSIKVFDQLQYQHNIKGGCPYVLVQDRRQGKQSRIQLTVKIDQQGQKTVSANIQQPSQESVVIKPDQSILVDGQQMDCSQKACQSKQGGATVQKVQTSDGKTQIQLSTKLGLHATIQGQRIQVLASPLLRSRVRGLCGDADGEQWNEYKDPQDRVQKSVDKFIQSWQQHC